ncbi:MAG: hypothetical protein ACI85O_003396 [Saprospiraceae bacterium]|jgi:hypothetical protein
MNFSKYIIFSFFAISLVSCEGFFETQVKLPTPEHTPILAVSCFLDADSSTIFTQVNRTFGLFEETVSEEDDHVTNATVALYEGGNLLYTLSSASDINGILGYAYSEPGTSLTEFGKTYELRVSHPDFADVIATQILPQPVPLSSTEYRETESTFSDTGGQLKLTFNDPAGEKNYYELYASRSISFSCLDENGEEIYSFEDNQGLYFETEGPDNPNAEYNFNYNSILLKDEAFDGQTYTFNADFYENNFFIQDSGCADTVFDEDKIKIYWRTVTEEYYRYTTSLRQNSEAADNPFAEPVSVFTNFNNGVGAFCMRSQLVYEVE